MRTDATKAEGDKSVNRNFQNFFRTCQKAGNLLGKRQMQTPAIDTTLRELVKKAQEKPAKMKLLQLSRIYEISYDRLWRFMREQPNAMLRADEAQRLYEGLTGKPLLPSDNEL